MRCTVIIYKIQSVQANELDFPQYPLCGYIKQYLSNFPPLCHHSNLQVLKVVLLSVNHYTTASLLQTTTNSGFFRYFVSFYFLTAHTGTIVSSILFSSTLSCTGNISNAKPSTSSIFREASYVLCSTYNRLLAIKNTSHLFNTIPMYLQIFNLFRIITLLLTQPYDW